MIDDDKHVRELYHSEFSEIGHEVLTVPDGCELIAKLEEFNPDLIVLDIKSGDLEGLQLLQKIRGFAPELPIVVCSAYDFSRWNIGRPTLDWCVVKSFDLTRLKAKVERALKAKTPFAFANGRFAKA